MKNYVYVTELDLVIDHIGPWDFGVLPRAIAIKENIDVDNLDKVRNIVFDKTLPVGINGDVFNMFEL